MPTEHVVSRFYHIIFKFSLIVLSKKDIIETDKCSHCIKK